MKRRLKKSWIAAKRFLTITKDDLMKVDLSGDELDTRNYNRDNGDMAAENAISQIQ